MTIPRNTIHLPRPKEVEKVYIVIKSYGPDAQILNVYKTLSQARKHLLNEVTEDYRKINVDTYTDDVMDKQIYVQEFEVLE